MNRNNTHTNTHDMVLLFVYLSSGVNKVMTPFLGVDFGHHYLIQRLVACSAQIVSFHVSVEFVSQCFV